MPVSELTSHTGYWLRLVSNAVSLEFARKLAAEGVTAAEWVILRTLYEGEGMAPSAMAEKLGMTRGAISKLAERLLTKSLIMREDDAGDRRAHTLSLTGPGRDKIPVLAALADRNDSEFFGAFDPQQREMLEHLLRMLVRERGLAAVPLD